MSDILVPSHKEIVRLVDAFRHVASMQARMKITDLAERLARDHPNLSNANRTGLSHSVVSEDRKVIALRQRQSSDDKANCA